MGQVDFAYAAAADAAGLPLAVSVFADCDRVRREIEEDVAAAGLGLRQSRQLADLADGEAEAEAEALGEVILLDSTAPDARTIAALARIDARAANSGAQLVISTNVDSLEDVFACCSQSSPQILVNARRADRIIALGRVLAHVPVMRLRELSVDDRLTLLRLTEQVGQIAEKLERLGDDGDMALNSPATAFRFDYDDGGARSERAEMAVGQRRVQRPALPDARLVRKIIAQRQMRSRFFDGELFADPAWDMLLDLTAARVEHVRVSVTSLCIASGVPPTTALRWIGQMKDAGLLERVEDETDRRRAFIALSDMAADAMARLFAEMDKKAALLV